MNNRDMVGPKQSKSKALSFGFGRKKAKKEAKILANYDRSLQSLEALKIHSDVSSDSGSSTRLSPISSPLLFDKDATCQNYRAAQAQRARQMSCDGTWSLRSGSEKSYENLSEGFGKDRLQSSEESRLFDERLPKHYDKINEEILMDSNGNSHSVMKEIKMKQKRLGKTLTGADNDDVFLAEGSLHLLFIYLFICCYLFICLSVAIHLFVYLLLFIYWFICCF